MNNTFFSTNNVTVPFNQNVELCSSVLFNERTIEEDESVVSEPMSLSSSPVSKDIENRNCLHNTDVLSEQSDILSSIYEIPEKYQHIFASYPSFNAMQSEVLGDVLYSDVSIALSAPTGSGKTVVFELAIIRLLIKLEDLNYEGECKIVYIAPVKALCSERLQDWRCKFSSLGLRCQEFTGDTDEYDLASVSSYHLLLTTPEKWDSLTRKWKDNTRLVQMVKLFLIDEVHLLNEIQRGPTLEAVVSRMKTVQEVVGVMQRQKQEQHSNGSQTLSLGIRFLAVSATFPNIEDVACWLGDTVDSPAKFYKISEDKRPVKLQRIVLGYPYPFGISPFRFEMSLSYKLRPLLFKYADGKPALIFCSTRKGVEQTCSTLTQQITFRFNSEEQKSITEIACSIIDNKLKDCVMVGVGYHHAGMEREDRQAVERMFREGMLPVLVTTSTLAMGVNLPAHLVIVKATQQYIGGGYQDYTETQILQMIGRAGRPQFDTNAVAIIMTKESQRIHYENLVGGKDLIESKLHQHLAEHLNSEVVLRTVTDIGYAMEWIRSTYLYVRALKNPTHYGIPGKLNKKGIEGKLQEMCQRELNALASAKLLTIDLMDVRPTPNGHLMARFYLHIGTMKVFQKVNGNENLEEIVAIVSACEEFSGMQLRVSEKKTLNLLNKARDRECIRFPLPTRILTREMKINCLIQAFLGCLPISESSLKQDIVQITWIGKRVANALVQYLLQQSHYQALLNATTLAKCFYCKIWESSPYVSRQLKRIGPTLSSLLAASNKTTFQSITEANPRDLESIINRAPPIGDNLIDEIRHLPHFELKIETVINSSVVQIQIYVEMTNRCIVQEHNTAGNNHWLVLLVGDSNNKLIFRERFKDVPLLDDMRCWTIKVENASSINEVYVNLISEQWVGLDVHSNVKLHQPRQTPLQVKNALEKYLTRKGVNVDSISSKWSNSKTNKRPNSSIVDKIRDMSERRLSNTPNKASTKVTLDKFKYTPSKKPKLLPSTGQHKSVWDERIPYLSEFPNADNHNQITKPNVLPFMKQFENKGDENVSNSSKSSNLEKLSQIWKSRIPSSVVQLQNKRNEQMSILPEYFDSNNKNQAKRPKVFDPMQKSNVEDEQMFESFSSENMKYNCKFDRLPTIHQSRIIKDEHIIHSSETANTDDNHVNPSYLSQFTDLQKQISKRHPNHDTFTHAENVQLLPNISENQCDANETQETTISPHVSTEAEHISSLVATLTSESKIEVQHVHKPTGQLQSSCHETEPLLLSKGYHNSCNRVQESNEDLVQQENLKMKLHQNFESTTIAVSPSEHVTIENSNTSSPKHKTLDLHQNSLFKPFNTDETPKANKFKVETPNTHNIAIPESALSTDAKTFHLHQNSSIEEINTDETPNISTSCKDNTNQSAGNNTPELSSKDTETKRSNRSEYEGVNHFEQQHVITHDKCPVSTICPTENEKYATFHTNKNENSLNTEEHASSRRKITFQKTLPKHFYPIFIKSLHSDSDVSSETYLRNSSSSLQDNSKIEPHKLVKEPVTEEDVRACLSYNGTKSETLMKEIENIPQEKEETSNTTILTKNETLKLYPMEQDSVTNKTNSFANQNVLQDDKGQATTNEGSDRDFTDSMKVHYTPKTANFELLKDLDNFLIDEEKTEITCMDKINMKNNSRIVDKSGNQENSEVAKNDKSKNDRCSNICDNKDEDEVNLKQMYRDADPRKESTEAMFSYKTSTEHNYPPTEVCCTQETANQTTNDKSKHVIIADSACKKRDIFSTVQENSEEFNKISKSKYDPILAMVLKGRAKKTTASSSAMINAKECSNLKLESQQQLSTQLQSQNRYQTKYLNSSITLSQPVPNHKQLGLLLNVKPSLQDFCSSHGKCLSQNTNTPHAETNVGRRPEYNFLKYITSEPISRDMQHVNRSNRELQKNKNPTPGQSELLQCHKVKNVLPESWKPENTNKNTEVEKMVPYHNSCTIMDHDPQQIDQCGYLADCRNSQNIPTPGHYSVQDQKSQQPVSFGYLALSQQTLPCDYPQQLIQTNCSKQYNNYIELYDEDNSKYQFDNLDQPYQQTPPFDYSAQLSGTFNSNQYGKDQFKYQSNNLRGSIQNNSQTIPRIPSRSQDARKWNDLTRSSTNPLLQQSSSPRNRNSGTQFSKFGDSQPWIVTAQETINERTALNKPHNCAVDSASSTNLKSQWEKFEISPFSSENESFESCFETYIKPTYDIHEQNSPFSEKEHSFNIHSSPDPVLENTSCILPSHKYQPAECFKYADGSIEQPSNQYFKTDESMGTQVQGISDTLSQNRSVSRDSQHLTHILVHRESNCSPKVQRGTKNSDIEISPSNQHLAYQSSFNAPSLLREKQDYVQHGERLLNIFPKLAKNSRYYQTAKRACRGKSKYCDF